MSNAEYLCKQFGPRSGFKLFGTLMVFLKEFFKNIDFEKNEEMAKNHEKLPSRQRVRGCFFQMIFFSLSFSLNNNVLGERSGSVVECFTRDRGAMGSSLTGVTALCP